MISAKIIADSISPAGCRVTTMQVVMHRLYDRLAGARPPHASPFEHVCRPLKVGDMQIGNLIGWRQLRHEVFGVR